LHVINPHRPTASTIYLSCDRSTPSNCIYHLHFTWSIHTIQLHLPFTFHLIHPHHPTASTIYIPPHPSTPSKCINCLSRTWIDQSTPSNCNLTYFASCFIQTVDEVRVSGISPTLPPSSATRFFALKIPAERNEQSNNPNCFPQLLAQNLIWFHRGFSVLGRGKNRGRIQSCDNCTTKIVDDEIMKFCNALITKNKPQKEEEEEEEEETIAV
jgi:hypothetical protein